MLITQSPWRRCAPRGAHFHSEIVVRVGVKQIVVDDPSGNPIEIDEPTIPEARQALPT